LKRLPKALGYKIFLLQENEMKNSLFEINNFIDEYYKGFFKRFSRDFQLITRGFMKKKPVIDKMSVNYINFEKQIVKWKKMHIVEGLFPI